MPKFILDHGSPDGAKTFAALDAFTQGYVEAMFFTSTGNLEDGDLETASVAELAPQTLDHIQADCDAFRYRLLPELVETIDSDSGHAGRDFWYTRNGHGVGFWDGDWPEPDATHPLKFAATGTLPMETEKMVTRPPSTASC